MDRTLNQDHKKRSVCASTVQTVLVRLSPSISHNPARDDVRPARAEQLHAGGFIRYQRLSAWLSGMRFRVRPALETNHAGRAGEPPYVAAFTPSCSTALCHGRPHSRHHVRRHCVTVGPRRDLAAVLVSRRVDGQPHAIADRHRARPFHSLDAVRLKLSERLIACTLEVVAPEPRVAVGVE